MARPSKLTPNQEPAGRCSTCANWRRENLSLEEQSGGKCHSPKLSEDYYIIGERPLDALVYDYQEGGGFWTGPQFGCVHWSRRS